MIGLFMQAVAQHNSKKLAEERARQRAFSFLMQKHTGAKSVIIDRDRVVVVCETNIPSVGRYNHM